MSYTSDEQKLEPSIYKILEGFEDFNSAANARHKQNAETNKEWTDEHLDELVELQGEILKLKRKLQKLQSETV